MKILKINSRKDAEKSAILQAVISALFCILYAYIIMIFTGGEEFVGKQPSREIVNGIRHDVVLIVCGVIAGLIPILLLRYTKIKYLCWYLPLSIAYYLIIMFAYTAIFGFYNIFDLITYATRPVPIGSFIGTVIAILFNHYRNNIE